MSTRVRRFCRLWVALLVLALVGLPGAGRVGAQEEATPLLLGQMAFVRLEAEGSQVYQVSVPADGIYFLATFGGDPQPFQVALEDAEGVVVLKGNLTDHASAPIDLTAGDYFLTLSSEEGGEVGVTLVGLLGGMSRRADDPGTMRLGGAVLLNNVRSPRYGVVEIPEFATPMPVMVVVAPAGGPQVMAIQVEGDDAVFSSGSNEDDPAEPAMALFWTDGGRFTVTVEPWDDPASGVAMVLMGPEPDVYQVGDTIEDDLAAGMDRWLYVLELDTFYEEVRVWLTWEDPEVDLDLAVVDALADPTVEMVSGSTDTTEEEVTLTGLIPGRYLIVVDRYGDPVEVSFTVEITGQEGTPPVALEADTMLEDEIDSGETRYYSFQAPAEHTIRVMLTSDDEAADLWFEVGLNLQGIPLATSTGFDIFGSSDTLEQEVLFMTPADATYYVAVHNEGESTAFQIGYADEGMPPTLDTEDVRRGQVGPGGDAFFRLPVDEAHAGGFLTVILVGDGKADLDLTLELVDERGDVIVHDGSVNLGANEIAAVADAPAGTYRVMVSSYGEEASTFTLVTEVQQPEALTQASLEVINEGDVDLCTVYVMSALDEEEPTNRLTGSLGSGESTTLELPADRYTVEAYDCEGNLVDQVEDAVIQGEMFWRIP